MADMLLKDSTEAFKVWHHVYERTKEYDHGSEEYNRRFAYFKKQLAKVNAHNADETKTWTETVSIFADRSPEEMAEIFKPNSGFPALESTPVNQISIDLKGFYNINSMYSSLALSAINWTSYSGPVYDQNPCGCCYAFASSNAVETNYQIKYGTAITVSRQQIVDCSTVTNGCNGGNIALAIAYLWSAGAVSNTAYPFIGKQNSSCQSAYNATTAARYVKHIINPGGDYGYSDVALFFLLKQGAVAINIDGTAIQSYAGGIMAPKCSQNNHAVLLVGYDPVNDVWIIKNSWNTWWGEKGFLRLKRNNNDGMNNCFINLSPILPVVE